MNDTELFKAFEKEIKNRGWSMEEAAKKIGVSRASLFNWKNGGVIGNKGRAAMSIFIKDCPVTGNGNTIVNTASSQLDEIIARIMSSDISAEDKVKVFNIIQEVKTK